MVRPSWALGRALLLVGGLSALVVALVFLQALLGAADAVVSLFHG